MSILQIDLQVAKSYKNQTKLFILENKKQLLTILTVGIIASIISIILTTTSSTIDSTIKAYIVTLWISSIIPNNINNIDTSKYKFAIYFPGLASGILISQFIGFYIIAVFVYSIIESILIGIAVFWAGIIYILLFFTIFGLIISAINTESIRWI